MTGRIAARKVLGRGRAGSAWQTLVEVLTRTLGPAAATPEMVADDGGRLAPARYRVFRWPCPSCLAGCDDPGVYLGHVLIRYSPFVVDSEGFAWCDTQCPGDRLARVLRQLVTAGEVP